MQHGQRPVPLGEHSQQRQGDRVVAAECQQSAIGAGQLAGTRLDLGQGGLDVERVDGEVAGVHDLERAER